MLFAHSLSLSTIVTEASEFPSVTPVWGWRDKLTENCSRSSSTVKSSVIGIEMVVCCSSGWIVNEYSPPVKSVDSIGMRDSAVWKRANQHKAHTSGRACNLGVQCPLYWFWELSCLFHHNLHNSIRFIHHIGWCAEGDSGFFAYRKVSVLLSYLLLSHISWHSALNTQADWKFVGSHDTAQSLTKCPLHTTTYANLIICIRVWSMGSNIYTLHLQVTYLQSDCSLPASSSKMVTVMTGKGK